MEARGSACMCVFLGERRRQCILYGSVVSQNNRVKEVLDMEGHECSASYLEAEAEGLLEPWNAGPPWTI